MMGSSYNTTKLTLSLCLMLVILTLNYTEMVGGLTQLSSTTSGPAGRKLLQTQNVSEPARESDDTVRVDPLDNLKKYRGGYDIRKKHYWSSTIFTGIYGYAIGVFWLLCGLAYGGFLLATTTCCNSNNRKLQKKKKGSHCHNKYCYLWWPIILATLFTILAITASGLVLGGTVKFHSRAKTVVDIIIDTANEATKTIYNTTGAMKDISTNLQGTNSSDPEASTFLNTTSQQLDSTAADIHRQARKNRRLIDTLLKIMYIVTMVVISLTLTAVIALSAFGILKLRRPLHLLLILCWLLTVFCWLFFGMYFFIEKFAGDTCTALEDFQQDPYNSSLSSILPCDELLSAKPVLSDVSAGVYDLVNKVNANITEIQGTSYIQVCNPFSGPPQYQYQPDNCPTNAIPIGDIPQVLRLFTCSDDANNGTCNGGVYMSSTDFRTIEAYSSSIQDLLNAYPGMESLVECQTVKDAFTEILHKHCKPLKKNAHMVWASLVFLSTVMVALVMIWITEAHHERKYHFSDGSVKPHSVAANTLESGTAKALDNDSNPNSVL
ncbi:uncharacterized protein LOC132275453 [Cornus florida]|uniref:uncharacterized protein LOC132275453 n=1 Tax=Cornus florida TaxID=4283 RepID=UPI00289BC5AC|nr:uncharacterized protein LOC132275453 [Cornus florida]